MKKTVNKRVTGLILVLALTIGGLGTAGAKETFAAFKVPAEMTTSESASAPGEMGTPEPASTPASTEEPQAAKTKSELVSKMKKKLASVEDEGKFLIRAKRLSTSKVKLTWKDADDALIYQVYKKQSGKTEKKLGSVKGGSYTAVGLKASKKYKFYVKVYYTWKGTENGEAAEEDILLAKSIPLTVITGGKHFMNTKKLAVKLASAELYKKQMHSIRTRIWLNGNKKVYGTPKLYYYSTASSVAKVDGNGLVTAKKKGTAVIFVLAPNGVYDKVKIKVKG